MKNQKTILSFQVTAADRKAIRDAAKKRGINVSTFLRMMAASDAPEQRLRDILDGKGLSAPFKEFLVNAIVKENDASGLLNDDDRLDRFIEKAGESFQGAVDICRGLLAEDMSKACNNPLLSEDLDAECLPVETVPKPVQDDPGPDMTRAVNNPMLYEDFDIN